MVTVKWDDDKVIVLDQRELPLREKYSAYTHYTGVAQSIIDMEIRGAPAIGIAAAMGIALAAFNLDVKEIKQFKEQMEGVLQHFLSTRPTAVNISWTVNRMKKILESGNDIQVIRETMKNEALDILKADVEANRQIGKYGSDFLDDGDVVLTHCNAGALATGGYGTALGVIRSAVEQGKKIEVFACETRPYLQGARLTAWELLQDNIPVTVITDNMSGHFMSSGVIKKVIVGADRIAANGDTANKIGTYMHSVLAREHGVPFYVAAPVSTLDPDTPSGTDIAIEERSVAEVAFIGDIQLVPEGVHVRNPSFDITPAANITAIITEKGVIDKPAGKGIKEIFSQ